MEAYRIADEPRPGALAQLAVNPMWPLFGFMFGGVWLSWPWFVLNGFALGSPTLRREVGIAALGLAGAFALAFATVFMIEKRIISYPSANLSYVLLAVTVWKLGISYWLHVVQSRTFGVYEYYGGIARNGAIVLIAAYFLSGQIVTPALKSSLVLLLALQ